MTPKIALAATLVSLSVLSASVSACAGSSPAPSAAPAGDSTGAAAGGCGDDVVKAVKQAVSSTAIQKIQVIGGCSMVSIQTSLGATGKADGQKICEAAAKVAYSGSVMSVSVDGADGHELSNGIKGAPCL